MEDESSDLKRVDEVGDGGDFSNSNGVVSLNRQNGIKKRNARNEQPNQKIHLLEIIGNAIIGGTETYVENLVSHLPHDRFRITCLCPFESLLTKALRRAGCEVFVTPMDEEMPWRSIQMAVELVRHRRINLIHANLPNAHMLAGLVGRLTGTPAVATIHGRYLHSEELAMSRLTGTHLLIICQEAFGQALALGVPLDRLTHIPNGVNVEKFTPSRSGAEFRAAIGVPPDAPLIGFVGRLAWEKAPNSFISVAERVLSRRPDVHFTLVGDGQAKNEVKKTILSCRLSHRVHLAGLWQNPWEVYPAFDIFVQTSHSEGMPLSLLEAMACGCPVIATDVGGVAEIVEVGTTGLLCRPNDLEWVASKIIELLDEPERLRAWGHAGRRRVEELFDLRQSVERTAALFQNLVAKSQRTNVTLIAKNGSERRRAAASLQT